MARDSQKFSFIIGLKDRFSKQWKTVKGHLMSGARLAKNISVAFAGAVTAAGAVFTGIFVNSVKANNTLAKVSSKLGETTERLAALRHAGELAGISTNTMDMALQRMVRRLSEAANGSGEAKDAIKELGLDAKELASLSPSDALQKIVAALQGVGNQGDRVRLAFKFFDSEGVSMVNLTADGLEKARKEAELLGIAIDQNTAKQFEELSDSADTIGAAFKGWATTFSAALAPTVKEFADKIVGVAKTGQLKLWATQTALVMVQAFQGVAQTVGVLTEGIVFAGRALNRVRQGAAALLGGFAATELGLLEAKKKNKEELLRVEQEIAQAEGRTATKGQQRLLQEIQEIERKIGKYKALADSSVEIYDEAGTAADNLAKKQGEGLKTTDGIVSSLKDQEESLKAAVEAQEKLGGTAGESAAGKMTLIADEATRAADQMQRLATISANISIPSGQKVLSNTGISIQPEDTEGSE